MSNKTDHWMPLLIGSYLRDTQHLDAERHGCYLLWLMHYWVKGPLPNSIPELVLIGRLRSPDAPSIAYAMLTEFFTLERDGMYHQKRADIEKIRWDSKRQTAQEKAVKAANTRWKNHAPSITSSNAQAMPEDMHEQCPTPTPTPSTKNKEQKLKTPSRAKKQREGPTKTELRKIRHNEFKAEVLAYWKSKNPDDDCPWDGSEGKALDMWLAASPNTDVKQFRRYLYNRYQSDVTHSERPSRWMRNITDYAKGPLDRFGKPIGGNSNGKSTAQSKQANTIANVQEAVARIRGVGASGVGEDRSPAGGGSESGAPFFDDSGVTRH